MIFTLRCHFLFRRWVWAVTKALCNQNSQCMCALFMHSHGTEGDTSLILGSEERPLSSWSLWTSVGYAHVPSDSTGKIILGRDNFFFFLAAEQKGQRMPLLVLWVPVIKKREFCYPFEKKKRLITFCIADGLLVWNYLLNCMQLNTEIRDINILIL